MDVKKRHWAVALPFAAALHVAAFAIILFEPEDSGAKQSGLGGIEISLGPAGGAPGSIAAEETDLPEAEEVQPTETVAEEVPVEEPIVAEEPLPEEPVEVPTEVVEALPEPEDVIVEPTEPVLIVTETEAVEPVEQPKLAELIPPKRPVRKPPEPVEVVEPEPTPVVEQQTVATPAEKPAETPPVEQLAALPPSDAGVGGKSGTKDQQNSGSGDNTAGGGLAGAQIDYLTTLQAWLEKHKEYPTRAKRRRQEGTAILYFVMDRSGNVLDAKIETSSGYRLLDKEVMRMIKRAQPLPKMPADMTMARLELEIPIQFYLR